MLDRYIVLPLRTVAPSYPKNDESATESVPPPASVKSPVPSIVPVIVTVALLISNVDERFKSAERSVEVLSLPA